jgi:hypothetical protein
MINTVEKIYDKISGNSDTYKLTKQDGTVLWVPLAEDNTDYQAIQEWAAIEGNNIIDNGA